MIHFGTGGWRAVIGDGFTKANVQLLTLALARKMLDEGRADKGFVIGYDRRFLSEEAAGWAAEVMAGQGILCRIIHRESPTPLIMYTVAAYGLPYGMAITASHNPKEYNGYKVYWEDGAQFTPPHDKGVTEEVLAIEDLSTVKTTDEASATAAGKYEVIGREIDDKYIAQVKAQVVNQKAIDEMQDQISIVYTPLHGTGNIPARRVMKELGFTHVYVVPEQELPDGDFMFTAGYSDKENLFCWILSLGDQIELLEPCEFRGELAELGRRVYEIYR